MEDFMEHIQLKYISPGLAVYKVFQFKSHILHGSNTTSITVVWCYEPDSTHLDCLNFFNDTFGSNVGPTQQKNTPELVSHSCIWYTWDLIAGWPLHKF